MAIRTVFKYMSMLLVMTATVYMAGCSRETEQNLQVGIAPPVNSHEVPIVVFWDGTEVIAIPDRVHLKAGVQRARWFALNAEALSITYGNAGAIGLANHPECRSIHCDMKVNPSKPGSTKYSIRLTTADKQERVGDPQIIVDAP